MTRAPWWAYAALAASMALVGSYVGLSKTLVTVFPVLLLAWLRFGMAAVVMLPWLERAPGEAKLSTHNRVLLFWESFLGNFLFSICMLYGVKLTSALAASITMAAIPAAVALLSWAFLRERIGRAQLGGVACAVAGIALLAVAGPAANDAAGSSWLGQALLLAAVFCEASYVVIGKRLTAAVSPKRISALVNLWGLVLVTPLGLWQAQGFDFGSVTLPLWTLLLFYSIAASMVTVWLWMTGLRHVPAASAGVFTVMLPIGAAAVGVLVLGEPAGWLHGVAFALALAGVVLATRPAAAGARHP